MKNIITILSFLLLFGIASANSGMRWDLMTEIGERIKYEQRKEQPDQNEVTRLRALYTSLLTEIEQRHLAANKQGNPWKNDNFTKERRDAIQTQLPYNVYFDKSTNTISAANLGGENSEAGSASSKALLLTGLGVLVAAWFGIMAFLFGRR